MVRESLGNVTYITVWIALATAFTTCPDIESNREDPPSVLSSSLCPVEQRKQSTKYRITDLF